MSLLKRLDPGTEVDLEIFKHNTDLMTRCRGKVVWVWDEPFDKDQEQLFEAGIQFINSQLLYVGRLISYLDNENKKISA